MSKISEPVIKLCKSKTNKISIKYYPDIEKFNMNSINADYQNVLLRRAYDLAANLRNVKIYYNNV